MIRYIWQWEKGAGVGLGVSCPRSVPSSRLKKTGSMYFSISNMVILTLMKLR